MAIKKITISAILLTGLALMAYTTNRTTTKQTDTKSIVIREAENYAPIVVLELFTSQGCSSCPPADALLDKVNVEFDKQVIALSYHVDYWNYIGWKDPFSKSKYAEKQRKYNIKFKNRSNYTPQVVVNGQEHFVGSNASKLYGAIRDYGKKSVANKVELSIVEVHKKSVLFEYTLSGSIEGKKMRAVLVLDKRTTEVKRGENRNRTLTNGNIVVAESHIAVDGKEGRSFISIPEIVDPDERISLILLLENNEYDISGASKSVVFR